MVKQYVHEDFSKLFSWFYENYMVLNPSKCSFMCFGYKNINNESFSYSGIKIPYTKEQKLLGIIIDSELKFDKHINTLCKTISNRINALIKFSYKQIA